MKIKTTTIGAYPKPACTPIGDWFPDADDEVAKGADKGLLQRWSITDYEENIEQAGDEAESLFLQAIREVIEDEPSAKKARSNHRECTRRHRRKYKCHH